MNNGPGHFKREKQTALQLFGDKAKWLWNTGRSVIGNTIGGLGAFTEIAGKAAQLPFEGMDTLLSWVCTKSVVRTAMQRASQLLSYVQSFGRGIQNVGDWVAGNKTTSQLWEDIVGIFKGGKYVCDLVFEDLMVDNVEIGKSDKGAVMNLKFDHPQILGKPLHYGKPSAYLVFDKWRPIKCDYSMSMKYGEFANYTNELILKYKPSPEDEKQYLPDARFNIFFSRKGISFEKLTDILNRPWWKTAWGQLKNVWHSIRHLTWMINASNVQQKSNLKDLDKEDMLVIFQCATLAECHNNGQNFAMIFPKAEITDVDLCSLPRPDDFDPQKDRDGSFVRFTLNF